MGAKNLPSDQPTQHTEKGLEIPVPKREDVERDLAKLVSDAKPLPPSKRDRHGDKQS